MSSESIDDKIKDNINLVYSTIWKYFPDYGQDEDAKSHGIIGLWKAIETYDASYGTTFSTYGCTVICNEIRQYIRKQKRGVHPDIYLDEIREDSNNTDKVQYKTMLSRTVNMFDSKYFDDNTSERQKYIMKLKLYGYTQNQIKEKVGISQPQISRELKHLKNVYKECII